MHFLITLFNLNLTGSSTYTYALSKQLIEKGHQVTIFSPFHNQMADPLNELGVQLIKHTSDLEKIEPDIILCQHHFLATITRAYLPETPMIYISHGIIDGLENPPSIDLNISAFITVSEEVKNHLHTHFNIPTKQIHIIRNGIDTERFQPTSQINIFPTRALFIASFRTSKARIQMITDTCKRHNINLTVIGKSQRVTNIEDYINQADLVISVGRGALAAMSCARAVIILDHDKGDKMITVKNIEEIKKHNFSGRRYMIDYDQAKLSQEIQKYKQSMGDTNRSIIERDFNITNISEQILNLSQEAINNFKPKNVTVSKQELTWMYENFIANQIQPSWQTKLKQKLRKVF